MSSSTYCISVCIVRRVDEIVLYVFGVEISGLIT